MKPTLTQLSEALDRAKSMGYNVFISMSSYGGKMHYGIDLNQTSHGGGTMNVKGSGQSFEEAVSVCFSNFPENPLDGTGWKNNRIAPPTNLGDGHSASSDPIDADFTEVPQVEKDHQQ